MTIIEQLARELDRPVEHIENVVRLLDEGNTIPFIARYRKELHGGMDDTALRKLEDRLRYLRNRRGRGPLPSLQAQAPYPRDRRQGKGA